MDYWTAILLGLAGSLHCAGMCGPLALALPTASSQRAGLVLGRVAYNLGRVATYSLMGLIFGLAGHSVVLAGVQRWLSIALGLTVIAGWLGSRRLAASLPVTRLVNRLKSSLSGLLRHRSLAALTALGLLNGLLPCGLVYVACAGAAATGSPWFGARFMAVFGLGTIPMMLAISLSGNLVPLSLRLKLRPAIPLSVVLLAGLLILRGLSLGIPYLSPKLTSSSSAAACCLR